MLCLPSQRKLNHFNDLSFVKGSDSSYMNWCSVVRPKHYVQIIMTDVHAPSKYRATIPLRNRIEFANAFNCARGTPMNPENKCQVW
ncbi:hypothetical protein ANCCAN_17979 [Ancylostoma caninum]|uniref:Peptidase M13 C-terminal domain-containing protein n=1 Tax=Ancylostoma caninum TaxID=29170 RepID=A0A368FVK9_ANCCA|nr:hypothetical protein ANCCAN_17979 [Ancylostoma caninum]